MILRIIRSVIRSYRCILTNDYKSSARDIVEFYNLRGGKERIFDDMNNGFGWNRLAVIIINNKVAIQILQFYITRLKRLCLLCIFKILFLYLHKRKINIIINRPRTGSQNLFLMTTINEISNHIMGYFNGTQSLQNPPQLYYPD